MGIRILSISDDPKDKLPGQRNETILTSELREASITDIPALSSALKLKTDLSKSLEESNNKNEDLHIVKMAYVVPDKEETGGKVNC